MIYKFRAECLTDVALFLRELEQYKAIISKQNIEPDVEVELEVDLTLENLRGVLFGIEDSHVMAQTIARKELYTGERRYEV